MANRFSLRRVFLPVLLIAGGFFIFLSTNLPATATSYTFAAVADAYVSAGAPTTNYGSETVVWMDATPETNGYLRFNVQSLDGPVSSATLRVYMGSTNSIGFDVHSVADTSWVETGSGEIVYNNAPTIGSVLNASGAVTTSSWAEIDVTSYITGDGLYSFGVTTTSNNPIRFRTKEASSNSPQLVIETGSGATSTATATATNTPTATQTETPTATATDGPTATPTSTGTATNTPTNTPTPSGGGSTFTFNPVADAAVASNRPTTNYGLLETLSVDISPEFNSYLRFNVQGLDGSPVTATLRLYTFNTSTIGTDVLSVADNSWQETSITYNNAPTLGSTINSSGAVTANSWIEIDVTTYISAEGLVSLGLITTDPSIRISFTSREGTNPPELIVGTGGGPTPTPTATATATPTATPSPTPTVPPSGTRTWQEINTTSAPAAVGEYAMAYGDGTVVLYGGNATGWPYENSTWEFNGTNWTEVTISGQPNAVYGMSAVYDDNNEVIILFGGSDDTDAALAETWAFDASNDTWTQLAPTNSPPVRTYSQMVYTGTGTNTEIYLFGGNDGTTHYNDVWRYDGSNWAQVSTSGTPPVARTHHAIAYDSNNDTILLFGGRDATGALLADTWQLDLSTDTWSQILASGPSARMAHAMAFDPTTDTYVLVGGANNGGDTILNDTWHFSSSNWTVVSPAQAAPNSAYHLLVYDSTNDSIILFTNGETWTYE